MAKTIKNIIRDEETKELIMQILYPMDSAGEECDDFEFSPEEGFSENNIPKKEENSTEPATKTEEENFQTATDKKEIPQTSIGEQKNPQTAVQIFGSNESKFHPVPEEFWGYQVIAEERICDLLSVVAVIKKIPKENSTPEVEFLRENKFESETFRIPLTTLGDTKKFSEALANNHILLKQSNQYPVIDYLRADVDFSQQNRNFKYEHTPLGFFEYEGKTLYFWEKTQIDDQHYSKCIRDFGKFKMGNENEYDAMLEKYVFPDTQLSLAYSLGFSSVLAARLYDYTDIGIPLISFNGKSSTGKSLSCMLAISSFANPNLQSGSLMIKTDSSANGLISQFSNSEGVIFCMDDIDTDSTRVMSDTLYRLSNGTGRTVSSVKGDAVRRGAWKGTILINSETSPAENIHKGGINARLIEFKDVLWTKTAKIANDIRKVITKSYGHKGERFGKYVANLKIEDILIYFDQCKQEVEAMIRTKDSLSDRVASKYALILLTIRYLNGFFNIKLNESSIMNFVLINEEKNLKDRDKPLASYTYLYEYYLENPNNFNTKLGTRTKSMAKGKCYGDVIFTEEKLYICVRSNQMRDIMCKGGFTQFKSYRDEWKKRGYILHDDGRSDTTNKTLGRHYKFVYYKSDIDYGGVV